MNSIDSVIGKATQLLEERLKIAENIFKTRTRMCRYAKEFFITEGNEVIKMAAIITFNDEIREKQEKSEKKKKGKKKIYISIFEMEDTSTDPSDDKSCMTVIAFHCSDEAQ